MTVGESELASQLMRFDLSKTEARVYLTLLKIGSSNAGPLIRELSLHRQYIYAALDVLKRRGLVSYMVQRGRRVFQAASPSVLVALEAQRAAFAEQLVPALSALQSSAQDKIEVTTHFGPEEFFNNLITVLHSAKRCDGIVRVIGGASDEDFYRVVGPYYQRYRDEGQSQSVSKRLIAPEGASKLFKERFANEKGNELRTIAGALTSPTYTRITPELTTIETYSPQVLIIRIWNRAVARGHLEHFELLWRQARTYSARE
jgi:sugar-specific transcriptional regulator TrmB